MTRSKPPQVFIVRVYTHLCGAILAVVLLEVLAFRSGIAQPIGRAMLSVSWLLVLGGFILLGWMARRVVYRAKSTGAQYAGLALYVLAKTIIFIPLLYLAESIAPGALRHAAAVTVVGTLGLTAVAFSVKQDFRFLGAALRWGGLVALGLIVAAIVSSTRLGTWFDIAMIGLAGASILYDTSNITRRYSGNRPVAAALELFASISLMFWYALRLFRRHGRAYG